MCARECNSRMNCNNAVTGSEVFVAYLCNNTYILYMYDVDGTDMSTV